ncbi:MAG TPA: ADOP family duplicated permease [Bryobacteraceae bacterium]|jgi:putative ABC transport system permease protein|nr:ADOP family duplicated permease [Bryobacteraceae bacterium]
MISDLYFAIRTLRRSPAFTATVLLTLALGIGASTAVFSAMDRLLLRALPYPEPDRLVALHETQTGKGFRPVSLANLDDWRAQDTSFDGMAGFRTRSFGLRNAGSPVSVVMVGMVTSDLFRVLGSGAARGRTFTAREESDGAPLLVLSDGLWARQFHRAPDVVGRTVQLNEQPFQVIGILPPDFVFPVPGTPVDAYIPISHADYGARGTKSIEAVARLKPGVALVSAQAELRGLGGRLAAAFPVDNARGGADLESLDDAWKGGLRRPLLLLTLAALLLLAIVCTNVVNLILARALARTREMEIRTALGAGLADILRQLLAEALLLCIGGGALGLLLANLVLRGLPVVLHQPVAPLAIDMRALVFAAAVCALVTLLCGLAPALSGRRNRRTFRLRQSLVVGQIALSLVLLLSAGAFLRVFVKLVNRDPGFDSSHVYYFGFGLPEGRYNDRQMVDFHEKLRARLAEIPGVDSAGAVARLPLNGRSNTTAFQFEGAGLPAAEWPSVAWNAVDPAYFSVLRVPLMEGRVFAWDRDRVGRPLALVVNRAFEKAYGAVVGRRVQLHFWTDLTPKNQLWQIVGVVGDTYQTGLDREIGPQIYLPISQTGLDGGDYAIRTARSDAGLAGAIAAAVSSVDPNLERIRVRRLGDWVSASLGDRRLPAILTGLFAAIGLALTALGLYGTLALEIGQRRKEMAIRVALGASRASITGLVLKRGLALTVAGSAVGAVGFIAVGRAIESQLYEVAPSDPANAAIVLAILFACAIGACLRPAWSALRQAPIAVLREM